MRLTQRRSAERRPTSDGTAPFVEELVPPPDPVRCCEQLEGLPYRLFLDSAAPRRARPLFLSHRRSGRGRPQQGRADGVRRPRDRRSPRDRRRRARRPACAARTVTRQPRARPAAVPGRRRGLPRLRLGTRARASAGAALRRPGLPDVVLGIYDWVLAWDHEASRAWLISTGISRNVSPTRRVAPKAAARAAVSSIGCRSRTGTPAPVASLASDRADTDAPTRPWRRPTRSKADGGSARLELRSSFTHARLSRRRRARARVHLRRRHLPGQPVAAVRAPLARTAVGALPPSPARRTPPRSPRFSTFPRPSSLSASPERFLRVDERWPRRDAADQRHAPARRRPRARRGARTGADRERQGSRREPDDRRPDAQRPVARVRAGHAVRVSELFALEHYATVHHLVSTVVGELAPGRDALDLLRAAFPGGSITGAPKLRAMEIIAELEPSQRGVYCGSIGYWSVTGALDTQHRHPDRRRPRRVASTSAPAAASSPTPTRSRNTGRRSTRRAAMIDALSEHRNLIEDFQIFDS